MLRVPAPSMVKQAGFEICADGIGWERSRCRSEFERYVVDEWRLSAWSNLDEAAEGVAICLIRSMPIFIN